MVINFLKKLDKQGFLKEGIRSGVVPTHWLTYMEIYEYYLEQIKHCKESQAKTNCAIKFNMSERSVYHIIQKMNK